MTEQILAAVIFSGTGAPYLFLSRRATDRCKTEGGGGAQV